MRESCIPETVELCKKGCKILEVVRAFEQTVDGVTAKYLYVVVDSPEFSGNGSYRLLPTQRSLQKCR